MLKLKSDPSIVRGSRPLSAHILSALLLLLGTSIIALHIQHHSARRRVYLTHPPGSIGTVLSQTSHSGFGDALFPYDDEAAMRSKLAGLRFKLDDRTGAIVVDEDAVSYGKMKEGGREGGVFQSASATPKRNSTWDELEHVSEDNTGFGRRRGYERVGSGASEELARLASAASPR